MSVTQQAALLIDGLKTVGVTFWSDREEEYKSKIYSYKTLLDLKVDDSVIVDVRGQLKIVKVKEIHKTPNLEVATKWVIDKVDLEKFNTIKEVEKDLVDTLLNIKQEAFKKQAKQALAEEADLTYKQIDNIINETTKKLSIFK